MTASSPSVPQPNVERERFWSKPQRFGVFLRGRTPQRRWSQRGRLPEPVLPFLRLVVAFGGVSERAWRRKGRGWSMVAASGPGRAGRGGEGAAVGIGPRGTPKTSCLLQKVPAEVEGTEPKLRSLKKESEGIEGLPRFWARSGCRMRPARRRPK